jgi:hypothetical protein
MIKIWLTLINLLIINYIKGQTANSIDFLSEQNYQSTTTYKCGEVETCIAKQFFDQPTPEQTQCLEGCPECLKDKPCRDQYINYMNCTLGCKCSSPDQDFSWNCYDKCLSTYATGDVSKMIIDCFYHPCREAFKP